MRFLVDENLSPKLVEELDRAGHDAVHVRSVGIAGSDDAEVMATAREQGRVLLSADTDFGAILAASSASAPSVILVRSLQNWSHERQMRLLSEHLPTVAADLVAGAVVAFDEHRIRVRRLPM